MEKPGYAPNMTTEKVLAGIKLSEDELDRLVYRATTCLPTSARPRRPSCGTGSRSSGSTAS